MPSYPLAAISLNTPDTVTTRSRIRKRNPVPARLSSTEVSASNMSSGLRARIAERSPGGTKREYSAGSTAATSIGIANPGAGRSTVAPSASFELVIQSSPARTVVASITPGTLSRRASASGGRP
jgi:hypothetical protein